MIYFLIKKILDKFQGFILKSESETKVNLKICNKNVNTNDTVKLLGIEIDKDLTFDIHIAKVCSEAAAHFSVVNESLLR